MRLERQRYHHQAREYGVAKAQVPTSQHEAILSGLPKAHADSPCVGKKKIVRRRAHDMHVQTRAKVSPPVFGKCKPKKKSSPPSAATQQQPPGVHRDWKEEWNASPRGRFGGLDQRDTLGDRRSPRLTRSFPSRPPSSGRHKESAHTLSPAGQLMTKVEEQLKMWRRA